MEVSNVFRPAKREAAHVLNAGSHRYSKMPARPGITPNKLETQEHKRESRLRRNTLAHAGYLDLLQTPQDA